ncbi:MAG: hypothetical protein CSA62_12260 [Planctomycetota bacterium]|nr:MAG: hypothetical protein CSA62_12260 [Planctomycetota bacterium]
MKRIACLAVAGAVLAFTAPAFAHGGQYRGPGDTVPPNPGGSGGGKTGSPGSPTTPSPGSPSTPTPSGPTSGGGGPVTAPPAPSTGGQRRGTGPVTGGMGMPLQDDFTQWQFWWEFNKAPFLQLKAAIHAGGLTTGSDDFELGQGRKGAAKDTLSPSDSDRKEMIPALQKVLKDPSSNKDIVSSCMVALAKIGSSADPKYFEDNILPLLKTFLANQDAEKREVAALAMGIAAIPAAVPDLLELAKDSDDGRKLCERPQGVDVRTRSFSCYGLGLIAYGSKDPELKNKVLEAMKGLLEDKQVKRRDIQVAALNAIRLLRPDFSTEAGRKLQQEIVDYALAYLERDEIYDQIRSHAIAVMAKVCERGVDEQLRQKVIAKCMEVLDKRNRKWKKWTQQSAVQALGVIGNAEDSEVIKTLARYTKSGKDALAKNFAAIALGQIGGSEAKEILVKQLQSSRVQKMSKPWIALGLAVRDFNSRNNDSSYDIDSAVGEMIAKEMKKNSNALYAAGYAVSLGMMKFTDAGDDLVDRLLKVKNQDEAAGYFMVGLGLMRYNQAMADIKEIVRGATRRDQLLTQGSIALGLLGDKQIAQQLVDKMKKQGTVSVMSALAQALGFIGDRRSVKPLIQILEDKTLQNIPRAFAAVALGLVGDKEPLPWNSKIAVNANYRANVETLTGGTGGILDIL